MQQEDWKREEKEAAAIAREVGDFILSRLHVEHRLATKDSHLDLVTEVDRDAQQRILHRLRRAFPADAILAEEETDRHPGDGIVDDPGTPGRLWLVDPLDGTTNFVHRLPNFGVSIALAVDGLPVVGVVYDPSRRELFSARRSGGASLNGRPVHASKEKVLRNSLVATGLPYDPATGRRHNLAAFQRASEQCRNVRVLGSAALQLAYVACGRLEGFWEVRLAPWDLAAGVLLVTEAGGTVSRTDGKPFDLAGPTVLATNGSVHASLGRIVSGSG